MLTYSRSLYLRTTFVTRIAPERLGIPVFNIATLTEGWYLRLHRLDLTVRFTTGTRRSQPKGHLSSAWG